MSIFLFTCNPSPKQEEATDDSTEIAAQRQLPDIMQKALEAHGGLANWQQQGSLQYQIYSSLGGQRQETHLVNLHSRQVRIEADNYTLGMDGKEVWVSPDIAAFGELSPRFYHNLVFYFFAIPFVLADEGIVYEDLGESTLNGKNYRALKVSYEAGVGDSPGDFYIAHFNPETYQLEALLYTVTYFSGEKTENYNCLLYPEWTRVDGLWLPTVMEGHKFAGDTIGDLRYKINIEAIQLSGTQPNDAQFAKPANAEVDTLKTK
jgi:hypothetical protein